MPAASEIRAFVRSFVRSFVQAQPRDHITQQLRKMAGAFLEGQRNRCEVGFFLDAGEPILNDGGKFTFQNIRHTFNLDALPGARHGLNRYAHWSPALIVPR